MVTSDVRKTSEHEKIEKLSPITLWNGIKFLFELSSSVWDKQHTSGSAAKKWKKKFIWINQINNLNN